MKRIIACFAFLGLLCSPCQTFMVLAMEQNPMAMSSSCNHFASLSMDDFVKELQDDYTATATAYEESYASSRRAIEEKWGAFKDSTPKEWVHYSNNLSVRSSVDYEKGLVEIEVLLEDTSPEARKKAMRQLQEQLRIVDATCLAESGFSVISSDASKLVVTVKPNVASTSDESQSSSDSKSVLSDTDFADIDLGIPAPELKTSSVTETDLMDEKPKETPEPAAVSDAASVPDSQPSPTPTLTPTPGVSQNPKQQPAQEAPSKPDNTTKKPSEVLVLQTTLPPEHFQQAAQKYRETVYRCAARFNLKTNVIFAIIQTESAFRPRARSHVPAYGLMQLVPKTGGSDAYEYVFKKKGQPSKDFLYEPENNILLGTGYLSLVKDVYFKGIRDINSAYIVSIAAYNTGPSNVARALTGTSSLSKTVEVVNSMTPLEVYKALLKDLPHSETKDYVGHVLTRSATYRGI